MIKKNYSFRGEHEYSDLNFDVDLYKAGINITGVEATPLPNGAVMFTVDYEFLAQYADGQRWVKDSAMCTGEASPEFLADFKKSLIGWVGDARRELRQTKLNGEEA